MDDLKPKNENSLQITGQEFKEMAMGVKETADKWIDERGEERKDKYRFANNILEEESKQFVIDRALLALLIIATIVLSILDELGSALLAFLMLVAGYILRTDLVKKLKPGKDPAEKE